MLNLRYFLSFSSKKDKRAPSNDDLIKTTQYAQRFSQASAHEITFPFFKHSVSHGLNVTYKIEKISKKVKYFSKIWLKARKSRKKSRLAYSFKRIGCGFLLAQE